LLKTYQKLAMQIKNFFVKDNNDQQGFTRAISGWFAKKNGLRRGRLMNKLLAA